MVMPTLAGDFEAEPPRAACLTVTCGCYSSSRLLLTEFSREAFYTNYPSPAGFAKGLLV
jgi:hypothetical protein